MFNCLSNQKFKTSINMPFKYRVLSFLLSIPISLFSQNQDISYMSSGGTLKPLQANMDIRHYTLALDVDIPNESIKGYTEIDLILANAK